MSEFLVFLVLGVVTGSIYSLAGMGLVLTFKTSGIFNFAHGAQAAAAAYVMYVLRDEQGWPWLPASAVSILIVGIVGGFVLERMGFLLASARTEQRVVATVGLLVAIQSLLGLIFGLSPRPFPKFLPSGRFGAVSDAVNVNVTYDQSIIVVLAAAVAVGLYLFFGRSRLGASMHAVVDDPDLLDLRGTSPIRVRRAAWMMGSVFAAVSGQLLATLIGVDAGLLTLLVVFSFGAAAVGAFNSLPLTYAGGLLIGVGQALSQRYLAANFDVFKDLPQNLPFLILVVGLIAVPTHRLVERGARAVKPPVPPLRFRRSTVRRGVALALGGLVVLPAFVGSTDISIWSETLAFAVIILSLGLLVQTSGQVSLCQMAFAAVGGSSFARFIEFGVPWPVALFLAGLVAIPIGALVALPAIKLRGVYLAIVTFGFGILMQRVFFTSFLMFGKDLNLAAPRPDVAGYDLSTNTAFYYVTLTAAALCAGAVVAIRRGRLGRVLGALSDAPNVITAHGSSASFTKLYVFMLSAFFAAVGGALLGPINETISTSQFDFFTSLILVAALAVGGRQPLLSAFLAAFLFKVAPDFGRDFFSNSETDLYFAIFFGVAAVVAVTGLVPRTVDRLMDTRTAQQRSEALSGLPARRSARSASDDRPSGTPSMNGHGRPMALEAGR